MTMTAAQSQRWALLLRDFTPSQTADYMQHLQEGGTAEAFFARVDTKTAMRKVSFASRSEAGRYAANQRWKGHVKRVSEASVDPAIQEWASRINDAEASLKAAGFETSVATTAMNRAEEGTFFSWQREKLKKLESKKYFRNRKAKMKDMSFARGQKADYELHLEMSQLMMDKSVDPLNGKFAVVVIEDKSDIAGAGAYGFDFERDKYGGYASEPRAVEFQLAGSSGVAKGAGTAIFGRVVRAAAEKGLPIYLEPLGGTNATKFWSDFGFKVIGMNQMNGAPLMGLDAVSVTALAKLLKGGG